MDFCNYSDTYSTQQKKLISEEFQRLTGHYYLEHAGATLYSEKQLQAITNQLCLNLYANPHAKNISSKLTEDAVDIVRYEILSHFKTTPQEYSVIFTSGATESLKLISEHFEYKNGILAYLQDNHTSVLGMRAYNPKNYCLQLDEAFKILNRSEFLTGQDESNSLFVFPAQSNFSGVKYPLAWIERAQKGALNKIVHCESSEWFVALDAASFVSTNELDLSLIKPDFVTISFYKMFGFPTGLGALLVKNKSAHVLKKRYYGGGTVLMAQTLEDVAVMREIIHERFEDGTISFLSILSVKEGFNTLQRLNLNFNLISQHTFRLAQYVYRNLICLHHCNGNPVAVLYHDTTFETLRDQGPIVNFNLLRENGEFVGYAEVLNFANLYGIHLRTGCFCNPGACQYFLNLSPDDVKRHFQAGHVCGDQHDLVDDLPTGSVRISFGYMSTKEDADEFLKMIENCFVALPAIRKKPKTYNLSQEKYQNYFSCFNHNSTIKETKNSTDEGYLKEIILYPIKSCGGFSVKDKWPITSTGLKHDRSWMIINSSGVCVTQKNFKKLCLIRPSIDLEREVLILTYPGFRKITVSVTSEGNTSFGSLCQSKVCGDKIQGWDCGDNVAIWLSEVLESPGLRLLKQCSENGSLTSRSSKKNEQLQLSLANKAQYLLINVASAEWLRERISDEEFNESLNTTIQRFRPNFVVKFSKAFVENHFDKFCFGKLEFQAGGVCTRCQMICIDQTSGETSKEPLQTLSKAFKGKIHFGIYLNRPDTYMEEWLYVGCKVNAKQVKTIDDNN